MWCMHASEVSTRATHEIMAQNNNITISDKVAPQGRLQKGKNLHLGHYTYQGAIPHNNSRNGASSKEIEIRGFESKNTGKKAMVIFFRR